MTKFQCRQKTGSVTVTATAADFQINARRRPSQTALAAFSKANARGVSSELTFIHQDTSGAPRVLSGALRGQRRDVTG